MDAGRRPPGRGQKRPRGGAAAGDFLTAVVGDVETAMAAVPDAASASDSDAHSAASDIAALAQRQEAANSGPSAAPTGTDGDRAPAPWDDFLTSDFISFDKPKKASGQAAAGSAAGCFGDDEGDMPGATAPVPADLLRPGGGSLRHAAAHRARQQKRRAEAAAAAPASPDDGGNEGEDLGAEDGDDAAVKDAAAQEDAAAESAAESDDSMAFLSGAGSDDGYDASGAGGFSPQPDGAEGGAGQQAALPSASAAPRFERQTWHGVECETFHAVGYARHSLVQVSRALSIRGPCSVTGVTGDTQAAGFQLRNKMLRVGAARLSVLLQPSAVKGAGGAKAKAAAAAKLEAPECGRIDWGWASRVLQRWQDRMGTLPPCVLVLEADTKAHRQQDNHRQAALAEAASAGSAAAAAAKARAPLPRFFTPVLAFSLSDRFLRQVLPALLATGSSTPPRIAFVGAVGVGKSTHARFTTNALVSRWGACQWLDLDLGQGEFTPAGSISLSVARGALLAAQRLTERVAVVREHYLGAPTVRDPAAFAHALRSLVAAVDPALPLVVNTHGWVLSSGRRVTVEAVAQLALTGVVHLKGKEDERWVAKPSTWRDPAAGLNESVTCTEARPAVAPPMPKGAAPKKSKGGAPGVAVSSSTSGASTTPPPPLPALPARQIRPIRFSAFEVPAVAADRGDRAAVRRAVWASYTGGTAANMRRPFYTTPECDVRSEDPVPALHSGRRPNGALHQCRIPLRALRRVVCTELPLPLTASQLVAVLAKSLVAVAVSGRPPAASAEGKGGPEVVAAARCAEPPLVVAYGVVESLAAEAPGGPVVVTLRCPVPPARLAAAGADTFVVGWQTPDGSWCRNV